MGVEQFQPTTLSRWIAGATIPFAIGATQSYEALQKLGLTVEALAETSSRIALGASAFSVGMIALNLALLAHIRAIGRKAKQPLRSAPVAATPPTSAPKPAALTDLDVEILVGLAKVRCSPATEIAKATGKSLALVEFHLNDLENNDHVYATHSALGPSLWYIDQNGRRELVDRGLLK